ncbi:AAA ATPase-like domain-containing protein [Desulfonema limicola]|uniref:AAA ATPase-like domain-containing protein n=1 Tax=Desulfonema limicola TaxID=45656 RepID=A0A975B9P6_9BACT|nr:AAA family ATPase [Desulfonema limicola]QTA81353.1 AAA ATPase-like domain-containing protein [Desulfonema limicola]
MKDRIIIKDFGPVKNVDLILSDITVFIGQQASGKSTIAKLIHFFRYITGETPFLSADPLDLYKIFKRFVGNAYFRSSTSAEIDYIYSNGITLKFKNDKLIYDNLKRKHHKSVFIPASRAIYSLISESMFSLNAEAVNIDDSILIFGQVIEQIKKHSDSIFKTGNLLIDQLCIEILKGRFTITGGESRIYYTQDQYITLDNASSGQQEALPLLLILTNSSFTGDNTCITIEEPEAHLYPYTQNKLIELIGHIYNNRQTKKNFIITTHSPYILTSFNNLLFAYQTAGLNEKAKKETSNIIPESAWINPENLDAYYVEDGTIRSIYDDGLIIDNEIDDVSEDIAESYDRLIDIFQICS